jgi:hypothetical protein
MSRINRGEWTLTFTRVYPDLSFAAGAGLWQQPLPVITFTLDILVPTVATARRLMDLARDCTRGCPSVELTRYNFYRIRGLELTEAEAMAISRTYADPLDVLLLPELRGTRLVAVPADMREFL